MTKRLLISLTPPAVALLLASCSFAPSCGNSHPYKNYVARGPIKAPAGVTVPSVDPAYQIPAAGTVAAPAAATSVDPCLVTPPSVLTKEDMAKPLSAAPAAKPAVAASPTGTKAPAKLAPAAATKLSASPAPAPASNPPPVAGGGAME
ncbi:MAG TPA: hypothetical protein VGH91_06145 [Gammaproteobacteria bacterium]|jgi:hypothetical protein